MDYFMLLAISAKMMRKCPLKFDELKQISCSLFYVVCSFAWKSQINFQMHSEEFREVLIKILLMN